MEKVLKNNKQEAPTLYPKWMKQLNLFAKGTQFISLKRPCKRGKGISVFSKEDMALYEKKYNDAIAKGKSVLKFVPASGAASRMFKHLYEIESVNKETDLVVEFFEKLSMLPFYKELELKMKNGNVQLSQLLESKSYATIADAILSSKGLNYGNTPKGMVAFHAYPDRTVTAFEEHLIEAVGFCKNNSAEVPIHFTISDQYAEEIKAHLKSVKAALEKTFNVQFKIDYSTQDPSTDTVAVDLSNNPLRDENDKLVLRPGGHGALLKNLNALDSDIVFIKNIDNIASSDYHEEVSLYKKALAGKLLELQENVFYALKKLVNNQVDLKKIRVIQQFLEVKFSHHFSDSYRDLGTPDKIKYLIELLNRPIRVCGMVKNEGDVGGGPFLVERNGEQSLQIVESAQVDLSNYQQSQILNESTHFNPVDIVCGIKDYEGNLFDLSQYVDEDTYFISNKSKNGKQLKALEWPGLWNGGMANWLTAFIEVPITTFTPVKTVNDLFKKEHQPS